MKPIQQTLCTLFILVLVTAWTQAQSPQVFISAANGVDAGVCTLAAPCRNLTFALTQVTAGGEINLITSGNYAPATVTKAVTIQTAPGVVASISTANGVALLVNAALTDVVILRGLTLQGRGTATVGVRAAVAGAVLMERLTVNGFTAQGILLNNGFSNNSISHSVITNCAVGIVAASTVADSRITEVTIEHTRVDNCGTGISISSLISGNQSKATIRHSSVINCSGSGFMGSGGAGVVTVNLENCLSANNGTGINGGGANTSIRVSNSTIVHNDTGLSGITILSRGNNTVEDNVVNGAFTGLFAPK